TETLALHWDGSGWDRVPTPSPTDCQECTHTSLIAIGVVAPDDIWAAGNARLRNGHLALGTHIMVQHWDGSEWRLVDVPDLGGGSGDSLADIEVIGPDEIWFVGGDQPQPAPEPHPALTLLWNGSGFQRIPVPIVNFDDGRRGGNPINGISAIAPDDIWIVGGTNVNAAGAEDLSQIHHWDGSEWTHVPGPTPGYYNELFCVEAVASDDVWAAGEYWDVYGIFPFVIHWNGSEWTQVEAPDIFFDMHAFAPDKIYAGSGGIYLWDGEAWKRVEEFRDALYPHIGGLDAVADCELWASGVQTSFDRFPLTAHLEPAGSCPGDFNRDGDADTRDVLSFLNAYAAGDPGADFNADGEVTTLDVLAFLNSWAGCA
ncbi:MAG TPA: GC-type dockerin domain-anchored protein, partial [Phycisphaerales bacterium]|nr:GC-type dockerin domain-anchored protein [Phycisphaerales bacterium]